MPVRTGPTRATTQAEGTRHQEFDLLPSASGAFGIVEPFYLFQIRAQIDEPLLVGGARCGI